MEDDSPSRPETQAAQRRDEVSPGRKTGLRVYGFRAAERRQGLPVAADTRQNLYLNSKAQPSRSALRGNTREQRATYAYRIVTRLGLPATINVEPSDVAEFRNEFFERIHQECAAPNPEWTSGRQGAPLRDLTGFPLLAKYLGGGSIWLKPSKWLPQRLNNWVVISPKSGPFDPRTHLAN